MNSENKYWALSKISLSFRVLGWIAAGLCVIFFFIILIGGGTPRSPRIYSLVSLVVGAFYFMLFYGIGEVIRLLMDIEQNSRKS